jgi:uncharacterized OB-fold protein
MNATAQTRNTKPVVVPDSDSAVFWAAINESRFLIQHCRDCKKPQFYARSVCTHCKGSRLEWKEASGRGKIASFSVVQRAPLDAFRADVPYVLALIDLEEGVRFMCNVINCDPWKVKIGDAVKVVYEDRAGSTQKVPQVELV